MSRSAKRAPGAGRWLAVVGTWTLGCVVLDCMASGCLARSPGAAPSATITAAPRSPPVPGVQQEPYGELRGQPVERYTLRNVHGLFLRVMTYGATVTELHVPDRSGQLGDIVLGFDRLEDYVQHSPYFGATVGRVANRIANAQFELGGKQYALAANSPPHHLHGGNKGWDKVVWSAEPVVGAAGAALQLRYVSKAGEEGYPGTVTATTVYTLTDTDDLEIEMSATTDQPTVLNMAHHSYFNLAGPASGAVTGQQLQLFASQYTPAEQQIPTGRLAPVQGTPFDFTQPKLIGQDLAAAGGNPVGFDHNWVVDGDLHQLRKVARLSDPKSGRVLTLESNQPGVQFYTGNYLDGKTAGKGGVAYAQYGGLCLESQKFPNSINVPAWRDEVILSPGQTYEHRMRFHFSVE
jgi:aldose 1-epimerase